MTRQIAFSRSLKTLISKNLYKVNYYRNGKVKVIDPIGEEHDFATYEKIPLLNSRTMCYSKTEFMYQVNLTIAEKVRQMHFYDVHSMTIAVTTEFMNTKTLVNDKMVTYRAKFGD